MIVVIWRFKVREDAATEFESHYGPHGTWAKLFQISAAYRGTQLAKDTNDSLIYLTVDSWNDRKSYLDFQQSHAERYQELDRQFEKLTQDEQKIGIFDLLQ